MSTVFGMLWKMFNPLNCDSSKGRCVYVAVSRMVLTRDVMELKRGEVALFISLASPTDGKLTNSPLARAIEAFVARSIVF